MLSDTVVAIVPEELLPEMLTEVHRTGLGQNARVLRPRRSPLRDQLNRAGIPVEQAPERVDAAGCLLMILAGGRSVIAANLALRNGASATWIISRAGTWNLFDDHLVDNASASAPTLPVLPPDVVPGEPTADAPEPI